MAKIIYNTQTRFIYGPSGKSKLTRYQAKFFELMAMRCPNKVSTDAIMDALYGFCADQPYQQTLQMHKHFIAKKLNSIGSSVRFAVWWGRGYALDLRHDQMFFKFGTTRHLFKRGHIRN